MNALNRELVGMLACPECKGDLTVCPEDDGLLCERCQVVYPVEDSIPVMLPEQAVPVEEWRGSR